MAGMSPSLTFNYVGRSASVNKICLPTASAYLRTVSTVKFSRIPFSSLERADLSIPVLSCRSDRLKPMASRVFLSSENTSANSFISRGRVRIRWLNSGSSAATCLARSGDSHRNLNLTPAEPNSQFGRAVFEDEIDLWHGFQLNQTMYDFKL